MDDTASASVGSAFFLYGLPSWNSHSDLIVSSGLHVIIQRCGSRRMRNSAASMSLGPLAFLFLQRLLFTKIVLLAGFFKFNF